MSIDNISIEYASSPTNISIDFQSQIDNIVVDFGGGSQSVFSVNGLTGLIELTSLKTLGSVSPSNGTYEYTVEHNLNYLYPNISVYTDSNELVFSDIIIEDENTITLSSLIDMEGYKVVIQK